MDMATALTHLANGRCIRRPHWDHGAYIKQDEWMGMPVAMFHHVIHYRDILGPIYNFPLNDLLNDDWEIYELRGPIHPIFCMDEDIVGIITSHPSIQRYCDRLNIDTKDK